ncbi:hypothetical protein [Kitasatospora sp. NPDC088346]|uniref:hypothetical protein n=1 Tax=Kitasatospora sp. NPDC088346 TaxID=3364073 RepID=UPI003801A062
MPRARRRRPPGRHPGAHRSRTGDENRPNHSRKHKPPALLFLVPTDERVNLVWISAA